MKSKRILLLALALSVGLPGCSQDNMGSSSASKSEEPAGKLLEVHSLKGRPQVVIYMRGFQDMAFSAYLKDGGTQTLLFSSLPAMKSQFESVTNVIVRDGHANQFCPVAMGMYDVYWAKDSARFAIAFMGNFVAAYDGNTGEKIQVRDGLDNKAECRRLGMKIESFLDGGNFSEAQSADVRAHSYPGLSRQTNP